MTTHLKCASDLECIDLFLFVRFFFGAFDFFVTAFSFLCYCWNRGTLM